VVFLGELNILPSSGIGEVAADKVVEFVGEDFVEHLHIFVEVGRQIEVLKRYVLGIGRSAVSKLVSG
jgi:hypothetical protein